MKHAKKFDKGYKYGVAVSLRVAGDRIFGRELALYLAVAALRRSLAAWHGRDG